MTEIDVQAIVQQTIRELMKQELMKSAVTVAYSEISERLRNYYAPYSQEDKELSEALELLKADRYRHILWMYYRDGYTIEEIAEQLGVEVSTVTRNKKRLCLELYGKINKF